jgi:hypothetical protein
MIIFQLKWTHYNPDYLGVIRIPQSKYSHERQYFGINELHI